MSCKKTNCCRAIESELIMKSTAELKESVEDDKLSADKSIADLLNKDEEEKDEDSDAESSIDERSEAG